MNSAALEMYFEALGMYFEPFCGALQAPPRGAERAVQPPEGPRRHFEAHGESSILQVLLDEGAYSDVIREAQEIVELALKGMLRQVGVEPTPAYGARKPRSGVETAQVHTMPAFYGVE